MTSTLPVHLKGSSHTRDNQASSYAVRHQKSVKRCYLHLCLAATVIMAFAAALLIHPAHSNSLLARIHHSLIFCTPFKNPSSNSSLSHASIQFTQNPNSVPLMVQFDLGDSSQLLSPSYQPNDRATAFENAISWAQKHSKSLVMITIHPQHDAAQITRILNSYQLLNRIILSTTDPDSVHSALAANPDVMVAVPIHSVKDEARYRQLARHYALAFYLPNSANTGLFRMAHRDAAAVITDVPQDTTMTDSKSFQNFLAARQVNIVISPSMPTFAIPTADRS